MNTLINKRVSAFLMPNNKIKCSKCSKIVKTSDTQIFNVKTGTVMHKGCA